MLTHNPSALLLPLQDGNPAAFSAGELTNIVAIWRAVAEDYVSPQPTFRLYYPPLAQLVCRHISDESRHSYDHCVHAENRTHRCPVCMPSRLQAAFDVDVTTQDPGAAYPVSLYVTAAIGGSAFDCECVLLAPASSPESVCLRLQFCTDTTERQSNSSSADAAWCTGLCGQLKHAGQNCTTVRLLHTCPLTAASVAAAAADGGGIAAICTCLF